MREERASSRYFICRSLIITYLALVFRHPLDNVFFFLNFEQRSKKFLCQSDRETGTGREKWEDSFFLVIMQDFLFSSLVLLCKLQDSWLRFVHAFLLFQANPTEWPVHCRDNPGFAGFENKIISVAPGPLFVTEKAVAKKGEVWTLSVLAVYKTKLAPTKADTRSIFSKCEEFIQSTQVRTYCSMVPSTFFNTASGIFWSGWILCKFG